MPDPFVFRPRAASGRAERPATATAPDPALGPLAEYAADERITDLFVNGTSGLFVDRGNGAEHVPQWRASEREVRDLAVALVAAGGRHLDDQSPCVDVRLGSGVRVHAVLAPTAACAPPTMTGHGTTVVPDEERRNDMTENDLPALTRRRAAALCADESGAATAEYAITTMAVVVELERIYRPFFRSCGG
ncbi:hypothetical protein [Microbacterium sp. NPDC058345]|uniref:hypothetical protein n=1 Tax=Microbacterium sp. NPDC058345 TaxID=3346455 RepID=UPI00365412A5